MPKDNSHVPLLIAGTYFKNDAYPNVLYRIGALVNHPSVTAEEINCRLLADSRRKPEPNVVKERFLSLLFCQVPVFFRLLLRRRIDCLYIPYPSVLLQFLLSFLPSILKPRKTIIDAFISLYDTLVMDREVLERESVFARLVFAVERRAFNSSDLIIVDTSINADYYSGLFGTPSSRIAAIPLATNETAFQPAPYIADESGKCRILFIGTLIPLHGIRTIISAMEILEGRKRLSFHIIGDGQEAMYLEHYASGEPDNLDWDRHWFSSEDLNSAIAASDICLGIFGTTPKALRVCPYKIYHYARVGRPVITAQTEWTDSVVADGNTMPFSLVRPGDPEQLAARILELAGDPAGRQAIADKSRDFYMDHLSVTKSTQKLVDLITSGQPAR